MRADGLLRLVVPVVMVLSLGCASARIPEQTASLSPKEGGESACGWWFARFIMEWPQGSEPRWAMDPFLAHKVVAPVLDARRSQIALWRFHRRAARDQTGHQFSFIFYCSPETARQVLQALSNDKGLAEMKSAGLIIRDTYDDTSKITKPNIEDTCDPRWSGQIQKSWPYFAMGASEMWLNLVAEIAKGMPDAGRPATPSANLDFYKRVNEGVKAAWQDEGSHAFLHHLNAIFGYEPIMVIEKRLVSF